MALDYEDNPSAYDRPKFNGTPIPGTLVVLSSGGDRECKVEQQTSPDAIGAFTLVKKEEMSTVSYRIECTDKPAREAVRTWLSWLRSQHKQRPAPAFDLVDPRLEHTDLSKVVIAKISPWKDDPKTKKWTVEVTFSEYKKKIPFPNGKAKPKDGLDKEIEEKEAARKKAKTDYDAKMKALMDKVEAAKKAG